MSVVKISENYQLLIAVVIPLFAQNHFHSNAVDQNRIEIECAGWINFKKVFAMDRKNVKEKAVRERKPHNEC